MITSRIMSSSSKPSSLHFIIDSLISKLANVPPSANYFRSKLTTGKIEGILAEERTASTMLRYGVVSSKMTNSPVSRSTESRDTYLSNFLFLNTFYIVLRNLDVSKSPLLYRPPNNHVGQ